ncbi:hypothetical protein H0X48_03975 [Candidatus Dependentiae bacterium]|nr:hypothetical protein [Candidatus Dependentiae bacterium]
MKKILLLVACFTISHALAHKWTITNSTNVLINVRLKVALPLGPETYLSEVNIHPGSYRFVDAGSKCVKEIVAQAPQITQAMWHPKVHYHCPGSVIDVTNVNGLDIRVS